MSLSARACVLAAFLSVSLPVGAFAQTSPFQIDVQHLHPSALPDSGLAVEGGPGLPAWTLSFAGTLHYGKTLLRAVEPGGAQQAVLLADQLVVEPAIALGLPAGFAVQVEWPLVLAASDTPEARPLTLATLHGTGVGDPRLALSWRNALQRDLVLLASATVTVPMLTLGGSAAAELGAEASSSVSVLAGVEGRVGVVTLRGNVGVRARLGDASFAVGGGRLMVASELSWGAGVEVRAHAALQVLAEVYGSSAFDTFGSRDTTPLELLAAVRVHPHADIELVPFAGVGLGEGYGTPAWRVGATLRFYLHMHDDDGDGVGNAADRCPNEDEDLDGFEDGDGCPDPDNDADGLLDAADRCPNQAGLGRLEGCPDPDADHDGVVEGDRCPDQVEDQDHFEDTDGCPDRDNDGDGILDTADRCPDDAEDFDEFEDIDGCPEPDNDRDGIADGSDHCPREAEDRDGFEDTDGCTDADNDGDGVADGEDGPPDPGGTFGVCRNLPETAGGRDAADPDGCPDSAVRVDVAARRIRVPPVFFDSNADVIQQRSFADLAYVADIMTANTWIQRISVEGHTDDRGSDALNQDLSQRRAASVVRFLVEHGVDAGRLEPQGFGRSRPPTVDDDPACAQQRSSACRQAARRVVFVIAGIAGEAAAPVAP